MEIRLYEWHKNLWLFSLPCFQTLKLPHQYFLGTQFHISLFGTLILATFYFNGTTCSTSVDLFCFHSVSLSANLHFQWQAQHPVCLLPPSAYSGQSSEPHFLSSLAKGHNSWSHSGQRKQNNFNGVKQIMVAFTQDAFSGKASLLQIYAMDQLNYKMNKGLWHNVPRNLPTTALGPSVDHGTGCELYMQTALETVRKSRGYRQYCHFLHEDALGHHFF